MVVALTTGHKIGLVAMAAVFIAFALASSFLFPRSSPDFPGRGLRFFVVLTALLTFGMLAAVEVFAKEEHEPREAAEATTTTGTTTETKTGTTTETRTGETTTGPRTTTGAQPTTAPAGNAAAGKQVFTSAGCSGCHTLEEASANGEVGPNLDDALAGKDEDFIRQSIVDPNAEIAQGYSAGVMPQTYEDQLSPKQLDDLVAFLTSG